MGVGVWMLQKELDWELGFDIGCGSKGWYLVWGVGVGIA